MCYNSIIKEKKGKKNIKTTTITLKDIYILENLCINANRDYCFSQEELNAWSHLTDLIEESKKYYNGYPNKNRLRKHLTIDL